jgi:hypothetical protein
VIRPMNFRGKFEQLNRASYVSDRLSSQRLLYRRISWNQQPNCPIQ